MKILCVAEKPSIAKSIAQHLGGGRVTTRPIRGNQYVKNYEFTFNFQLWGNCAVIMTSVLGHLTNLEFEGRYRNWQACNPSALFEAETYEAIAEDKKGIAENIAQQARYAKILFIWTDCDREGEHIGSEVRGQARKGKRDIEVRRAKFSNTEKTHIIHAAHHPIELDERQANAVAARTELDLRIGAAFTRLQTLQLRTLGGEIKDQIISYGSCQFPTLGFVVDRYWRVRNFKPETFWSIKLMHQREGKKVNFLWKRVHLFDHATVVILFEECLEGRLARVDKVETKPTSKWRPLPLTTVELQMQGSRFLHMTSSRVMAVAEQLYQKGFISYPRTETDQFPNQFDLHGIIQKQVDDSIWGDYARSLLTGAFRQPRRGRHNDQAHPPIHPVNHAEQSVLSSEEKKIYEFVVRRFLACCSEDAKGEKTDIEISYGRSELFHANGLRVIERNYLDVYIYDKWESSQQLPTFTVGETFEPTEAMIAEGKTSPPTYLTEPELIALMDANGIGTDATMAEHITRIKDRSYVGTQRRSGSRGVEEFIPTKLGVGLIEGYDEVGFGNEIALSKPFLRKEMEIKMKGICDGRLTRGAVVAESLEQYREVFTMAQQRIAVLKTAVRRNLFDNVAA
ncbi:MAG: hypothetical protein Q9227_006537 [Pyrenula ochraceoflavens]